MIEPDYLYRRLTKVVGAKRLATLLGLSLSHLYRLGREPMDVDPDGTGARNDFDRIEVAVEAAALRPGGAEVVREVELWFDALFARVRQVRPVEPLDADEIPAHASRIMREAADVIDECGRRGCEPTRLVKEIAEAMEALERLSLAAQAVRSE